MDKHNLVRMANRIGDFFAAMPDRQEAVKGIADHIRRFWEPRMRREIMDYLNEGGAGLSDIVSDALRSGSIV